VETRGPLRLDHIGGAALKLTKFRSKLCNMGPLKSLTIAGSDVPMQND